MSYNLYIIPSVPKECNQINFMLSVACLIIANIFMRSNVIKPVNAIAKDLLKFNQITVALKFASELKFKRCTNT
jgi:hypothetical protein